ncbi:MAG: nicotinate-nucleotide adenylyltransferase [Pseudomonadota bacterium]
MLPLHQPFLARSARWAGRVVGLYGGSFNPAHQGHLHVSLRALRHLKLDALWWLVSPLNPLKHADDMAALGPRLKRARALIDDHPKLFATAIEDALGSRYSVETIAKLQALHPRTRFIWVMGADNLMGFHRWEGWQEIFHMLPIAVVDRPGYALKALSSPAARRFACYRLGSQQTNLLRTRTGPAWVFLRGPLHPASATAIRARMPHWADAPVSQGFESD